MAGLTSSAPTRGVVADATSAGSGDLHGTPTNAVRSEEVQGELHGLVPLGPARTGANPRERAPWSAAYDSAAVATYASASGTVTVAVAPRPRPLLVMVNVP